MQPDIPQQQTAPVEEPRPVKNSGLRAFLSVLEFCATVAALVFIILMFGLQSYHVEGQSMVPTLQQDDRLIVSKLGRTWSRIRQNDYVPERGEIIVFESPIENNIRIIKRVIALPGERVVLENGTYTIFNKENPQGFNPDNLYDSEHTFEYTVGTIDLVVPDRELFVSGDNRGDGGSQDSRNDLGTIPVENVIGKLLLRIAPVTEFQTF